MDIHRTIKIRRSVRKYSNKPIEPEKKKKLLDALRFAPSACNIQPWRFIIVENPETIEKLAQLSKAQLWIAQAPMLIVGCALPKDAYKFMGGDGNSADIDVTIALDHMTLAAAAMGLGTCWIGAFDLEPVQNLLGIPESVNVTAIIPVGYPLTPDLNFELPDNKRKDPEDIFCQEKWQ